MKRHLGGVGLLLGLTCGAAFAQKKDYSPFEPLDWKLAVDKAPIFRALADSGKAPAYHMAKTETVYLIGQANPHWLVVKRGGFPYFLNARYLETVDGMTALELAEALNTPLPVDATTKLLTLTEVVEVPGATQAQLYSRAYEWVAKAYNSANAVVQMHDKESGKIIGKGVTRVLTRGGTELGYVRHTLSIYVKDGKYKYELTGLEHVSSTPGGHSGGPLEQDKPLDIWLSASQWTRIKRETTGQIRVVARNLRRAMTAKDASDF